MLDAAGYAYQSHVKDLHGRPDFVLQEHHVVILVDGDVWQGWKFSKWRDKLLPTWESKIEADRRRDLRNNQELRLLGWKVVRLWEHQLKKSPARCRARIRKAAASGTKVSTETALPDDQTSSTHPGDEEQRCSAGRERLPASALRRKAAQC